MHTPLLLVSVVFFVLCQLPTSISASESVALSSADAEAGAKLFKKNCRQCHGPTAKGVSSYPKLAGQTADYLIDRLERYKAGEKFGPNTALMAPNAKKLSSEDIADISVFIASLE